MGTAITQNGLYLSNNNKLSRDSEYASKKAIDLIGYRTRLYIQVTQNNEIYYAALNATVAINYSSDLPSISLSDISLDETSPHQHLLIQNKIKELMEFEGINISSFGNKQIDNNFYAFLLHNIHQEALRNFRELNLSRKERSYISTAVNPNTSVPLDHKTYSKKKTPLSILFTSEESIATTQVYISVGLAKEKASNKGIINKLNSVLRVVSSAIW